MITCFFRVVVALLLSCGIAQAHDPGISDSHIQISQDTVAVHLRLDAGAHAGSIAKALADPLRVTIDGKPLPLLAETRQGTGHFEARFRRSPGRELRVELRIFEMLGAGHKHYLKIAVPAREPVETLLSAGEPVASVALPESF